LEDKYKDALPTNVKKHLTVQLRNLTKAEKLVKVKNSFKLSDELKKPAAGRKPPTVREAVMPKKGPKTMKAVGAKMKATKPRRMRSQQERPLQRQRWKQRPWQR
jgi:histone H1/5